MLVSSRRTGARTGALEAVSPRRRRPLFASAAALVAVVAAATTAGAQDNPLTIDGQGLPRGAGSPTRPLAKDLSFRAEVHPSGGVLPAPFERYRIVIQGGRVYPRVLPSCSAAQAAAADHARRCQSARIGSGTVDIWYGAPNDPIASTPSCRIFSTFYNLGSGLAIRLDVNERSGCPVAALPRNVLVAKFIRTRLGGKAASGIEFTVPPELRHIAGLSIVVKSLTGRFRRVLGEARVAGTKRSVGYFSSVACATRRQRLVAVSAVDENGVSYRASARVPC